MSGNDPLAPYRFPDGTLDVDALELGQPSPGWPAGADLREVVEAEADEAELGAYVDELVDIIEDRAGLSRGTLDRSMVGLSRRALTRGIDDGTGDVVGPRGPSLLEVEAQAQASLQRSRERRGRRQLGALSWAAAGGITVAVAIVAGLLIGH